MGFFESRREAGHFLRNLAVAFAVTLAALCTPVQSFQVRGGSMQPLLVDGEKVLVEQVTPRYRNLRRGDVIIFKHPAGSPRLLIKRVVALPGERVRIEKGMVFVNDAPLGEAYLLTSDRPSVEVAPLSLGQGDVFVLGDHRSDSEDSRVWGPLPIRLVVGRAVLAYWPPSQAGPLG